MDVQKLNLGALPEITYTLALFGQVLVGDLLLLSVITQTATGTVNVIFF